MFRLLSKKVRLSSHLNHLASRAYQNIYTTKRADKDAVKGFYVDVTIVDA